MRLNYLDLIRYGRFQDARITFPKAVADKPDVTIVFGQNEAGKSTAFNAFLELLFGIKAGSHPYAFRFDRKDLLVGAELELPDRGATIFRRNSKRDRSLLDAEDRPLNEAILASALHGLTRDTFEERFSLNDTSLRQGGVRIASAQGDLGQLLHAGLSGLTGMAEALDGLSARADQFQKKHGRGTALRRGNDRLVEIKNILRDAQLTTEQERNLRKDRDRKEHAFKTAKTRLEQVRKRQAALKAAALWYERTQEIEGLDTTLANYPDGPTLPSDTAERVAGLEASIAAQRIRIVEAKAEIEQQEQIITDHPEDAKASILGIELSQIDAQQIDGAPLIDRASTAQADLSRRIAMRDDLRDDINKSLDHLGLSNASLAATVLTSETLDQIEAAVRACLIARQSAKDADQVHQNAIEYQGEAPEEPKDLALLKEAYEAWKAIADTSDVEASYAQSAAILSKATEELPANWADQVAAGLPAQETLTEVSQDWDALTADLKAARKALDERAATLAMAEAELISQQNAPDAVDLTDIEETRRTRDHAWLQHKDDLTADTAREFETTLYADDTARAHYLSGAEARQRLQTAREQTERAKAEHNIAQLDLDRLTEQHSVLSDHCGTIAVALGFPAGTTPSAFVRRHQALIEAARAAASLANADHAKKTQIAERERAHQALVDTARALGLDPTHGDLPMQVQRTLTLEDSAEAAWDRWQKDQENLSKLAKKAKQARDAYDAATQSLNETTSPTPLQDRSVDRVQALLPQLRKLVQDHGEFIKVTARIEALENAIAAVSECAARLANEMGDETGDDPIIIINRARDRLAYAKRASEKRGDAQTRCDTARRTNAQAETALLKADTDISACFNGQGGADLLPHDRVAKLIERDRLRAARTNADQERQKARAGVEAEAFTEELALMPDATRAATLDQDLEDEQSARDTARDSFREAERIYREAFEAAERSDLITEQATLLEDLRRGARRAAVDRLGVLAAKGALRRLAAERRGSMLQDVEKAFVTMTDPAWSKVDVWTQAEGEKLVGIQPDGSAVPVGQMSTGTMGQLYFALRLAGYRSFAREAGPMPMVLDDIMETFDDTRAKAALKLCATIGETGQAILFTHHAHLVDLARDSIDGVSIVDMPSTS